jgi:hypothetical protein
MRWRLSGSFYPDFSRKLQSGTSEVAAATFHTATIRIHPDPGHGSRIVPPIVANPRGR